MAGKVEGQEIEIASEHGQECGEVGCVTSPAVDEDQGGSFPVQSGMKVVR